MNFQGKTNYLHRCVLAVRNRVALALNPAKRWVRSLIFGAVLLMGASVFCIGETQAEDGPPAWLLPTVEFVEVEAERLEKLFGALSGESGEMQAALVLWKAGRKREACARVLDYFRQTQRPFATQGIPVASPEMLVRAEDALRDTFHLQELVAKQPRRPDGGLDWTHHGPKQDKEWAWFLNRHLYFVDLLVAFRETRDVIYVERLNRDLIDWVQMAVYPDRLSFSESWRALEVARRIHNSWPLIFFGLQDEPSFKPEARLLLLASLLDHADSLKYHSSFWGGNHLLTEKTALARMAVLWPEFKQASQWIAHAVESAGTELMAQTYPDGAYKELTNHYQVIILNNASVLYEILQLWPGKEVAADLKKRLEAMWDYLAGTMRPSGWGPLNSASDMENNRALLGRGEQLFGRADWAWLVSSGARGVSPAGLPSRWYPYAGHAVMRSGWGADDYWSFFDIGPHGTAHQHDDRLHLSVSVGGDDILVDAGRYHYRPDKWKDYFTGPRSHNLLMVNGLGPLPPPLAVERPLPVTAQMTPEWDFFAGENRFRGDLLTGRGGVRHSRAVFHRRGQYWLVIDEILGFGQQRIETLWHFHPACKVELESGSLVANIAGQPKLVMMPYALAGNLSLVGDIRLVRGQETPPQGWWSPGYNQREPSTALVHSLEVRRPVTVVWLLWPANREAGSPRMLPEMSVQATTSRSFEVRLESGDGLDDRLWVDFASQPIGLRYEENAIRVRQ